MLRITPAVGRLATLFEAAGYPLYLVGGSVRDALLGHLGHDLDFTTSARPDEIEKLLKSFTKTTWDVGRAFGTIGAKVSGRGGEPDWIIEITTFRSDVYRSESRKPEVSFGDTLTGDLLRRDFTVNAMAIEVRSPEAGSVGVMGEFVDPHNGLDDLAAELITTPATAEESFSDDPLRMLRAARFTSQLGFRPAPDVVAAMTSMAERIEIISAERVRDELTKLLLTEQPRAGLDLLVSTGLAGYVLPELPALQLERDEHHRHKDVYEHSLTVLDQAIELEGRLDESPDLINRLAALLHDIGKPATRKFEAAGKVSFHHHDVVGAKLTRKRMKALRFSEAEIKAVSTLVELHLRFHGYGDGNWTDSAVRRYVRDAGPLLDRLHILTRADCTTRNTNKATRLRRAYDELEWRIDELSQAEELDAIRPDLDGNQIMAILELPPGREVGQAYTFMLEQRLENGPMDEAAATQTLKRWWAQQQQ